MNFTDKQLLNMIMNIKSHCKGKPVCGYCKFQSSQLRLSVDHSAFDDQVFKTTSSCLLKQLAYELTRQPDSWDIDKIKSILDDTKYEE